MALGAVILGGGFIGTSFATQVWHLYVTQGALVGAGVGFVYVPSIPVLSQWFVKDAASPTALAQLVQA